MSDGHRPFPEQIQDCLTRCDHALQRGRPAEAMRYLALARTLRRLARELAQDAAASAPIAPEVTEVHEVHAKIADLERRFPKRQRIGAAANDLRRELVRLRAQPPP